jgi:hypothetical protein
MLAAPSPSPCSRWILCHVSLRIEDGKRAKGGEVPGLRVDPLGSISARHSVARKRFVPSYCREWRRCYGRPSRDSRGPGRLFCFRIVQHGRRRAGDERKRPVDCTQRHQRNRLPSIKRVSSSPIRALKEAARPVSSGPQGQYRDCRKSCQKLLGDLPYQSSWGGVIITCAPAVPGNISHG